MNYKDLEDEMTEAIQRCCPTEEDAESAKRYFKDFLVTDLIDDALEN